MLRTNLFVLAVRSNNSGLSQQQYIVVIGLPPNLQPSLIYLKWVLPALWLVTCNGYSHLWSNQTSLYICYWHFCSVLCCDWSHVSAVTSALIIQPFTYLLVTLLQMSVLNILHMVQQMKSICRQDRMLKGNLPKTYLKLPYAFDFRWQMKKNIY